MTNAKLFEKLGKKTHLTDAGYALYGYSRAIFQELEEVEEVRVHVNIYDGEWDDDSKNGSGTLVCGI